MSGWAGRKFPTVTRKTRFAVSYRTRAWFMTIYTRRSTQYIAPPDLGRWYDRLGQQDIPKNRDTHCATWNIVLLATPGVATPRAAGKPRLSRPVGKPWQIWRFAYLRYRTGHGGASGGRFGPDFFPGGRWLAHVNA